MGGGGRRTALSFLICLSPRYLSLQSFPLFSMSTLDVGVMPFPPGRSPQTKQVNSANVEMQAIPAGRSQGVVDVAVSLSALHGGPHRCQLGRRPKDSTPGHSRFNPESAPTQPMLAAQAALPISARRGTPRPGRLRPAAPLASDAYAQSSVGVGRSAQERGSQVLPWL